MDRPIGLTLVALLNILGGILGFIAGILLFFLRFEGTTFDIELMLSSLVPVILGIGLWKKRNWARRASIILTLAGILTEITFAVFIASLGDASWWLTSVVIAENVVAIWMLIYLLTPRVRRLFLSPSGGGGR
jgi:hypothetical protein